ncbi:MAG: MAPEG family protein [Rhodobacteraceae bacterium]|nr:MAPEG family protein [Paracoccaceae bacterium]
MSSELSILALYGLLTMVIIAVQASIGVLKFGIPYSLTARDENRQVTGPSARFGRCADNSVVALALFAPAILILHVQSGFTANTLLAAQAFLITRLIYAPLYWFGIPALRTAIWAVGFLATAWLYLMAI